MPTTPNPLALYEHNKEEMLELLSSGRLVLVLGAGCSYPHGYPGWTQLMVDLESTAQTAYQDKINQGEQGLSPFNPIQGDPLQRAQGTKDYLSLLTGGDDLFLAKVGSLFSPVGHTPPGQLHKNLVRLPFRGSITTNFDDLLHLAKIELDPMNHGEPFAVCQGTSSTISKFLQDLDSKEQPPIAHLHGRYTDLSHIVLTKTQYDDAYALNAPREGEIRQGVQRRFLWTVLSTRPCLFVGFSFTDPHLLTMLNSVNGDWARWFQSWHYALIAKSGDDADDANRAALFSRTYGINIIFYDKIDDNHTGLQLFMNDAATICGVQSVSTTSPGTEWLESANQSVENMFEQHDNQ